VAIGGVRPEDTPAIIAAGGAGMAVVSGILKDGDAESNARSYSEALSRLAARDP
jgi:thiamine monophosphate synthase